MTRTAILAVCSVALVAAAACDDESGAPLSTTSTSSGQGGSTGGTGGASSGSGGSTSGTGGASSGTGGSSSSASSSGTGGEGPCLTCSEFIAGCLATSCPPKHTVCGSSLPLFSAIISCVCGTCWESCSLSCVATGQDDPSCVSCIQTEVDGDCSSQKAACDADVP